MCRKSRMKNETFNCGNVFIDGTWQEQNKAGKDFYNAHLPEKLRFNSVEEFMIYRNIQLNKIRKDMGLPPKFILEKDRIIVNDKYTVD